MKRINGIFEHICTLDNIELADSNARKGKHNKGIDAHCKHEKEDNEKLRESLLNLTYNTSKYTLGKVFEPKERVIYKLPYYPDRITHWAIMLNTESIWEKLFVKNTYACIKGRGIHKCAKDLKETLDKYPEDTKYCLKLDIQKFYPTIDHAVLKGIIRRKIKDKKLLVILDNIIDSIEGGVGVPIGNYLSQFFANLYLTYFDHWLKEEIKVKHYFRYADDIVILSDNMEFLKKLLIVIKMYLRHVLKLVVKSNYQVFKVEDRGVDFVGFRTFHTHVELRKTIKKRFFRLLNRYHLGKISKEHLEKSLSSYKGWLKMCNSKNLLQKMGGITGIHMSNWNGGKRNITDVQHREFKIIEIEEHRKFFQIHFILNDKSCYTKSKNKELYNTLKGFEYPKDYKIKRND